MPVNIPNSSAGYAVPSSLCMAFERAYCNRRQWAPAWMALAFARRVMALNGQPKPVEPNLSSELPWIRGAYKGRHARWGANEVLGSNTESARSIKCL